MSAVEKNLPQKGKIVTVRGKVLATIVLAWWLLSLAVVHLLTQFEGLAGIWESVRELVPAARKYAAASGFADTTTAFYCFYLVSTPLAIIFYSRAVELWGPLTRAVKTIFWLIIPLFVFVMSIGVNLGSQQTQGIRHVFNLVLTNGWYGASLVFLLFCHCVVSGIVCLTKDKGRRFR